MGIMTSSVDDSVESRFRKAVAIRYGHEKGSLKKGLEFAMERMIEDVEFEDQRRRAIERLEKGFDLGQKKWKTRDDMHERPGLNDIYRQQRPSIRARSKRE